MTQESHGRFAGYVAIDADVDLELAQAAAAHLRAAFREGPVGQATQPSLETAILALVNFVLQEVESICAHVEQGHGLDPPDSLTEEQRIEDAVVFAIMFRSSIDQRVDRYLHERGRGDLAVAPAGDPLTPEQYEAMILADPALLAAVEEHMRKKQE